MRTFTLIFILIASLLLPPLARSSESVEVRTEETYVPYDEVLRFAAKEGTTMTLEEYRALVVLAASTRATPKRADLPAVKYSLAETVYKAVAGESALRINAAFKLTVAQNEWVRCDLGPLLPGLGAITLDGEPGWVVTENGHAYLLVHGSGAHSGTLSFSLPIKKEEDVQSVAGSLLNSAAAVMHLEVPGSATAIADPTPLDATYDPARDVTNINLALGRDAKLALSWRRKHETQKNDALLLAEERISYLLYEGSPSFRWNAHITISRKKTDEVFITEPPGGRMVRLTGPNIHSWSRDGETLHILLEKPMLGALEIQGEGIVVAADASLDLGCPSIKNAVQDTRYAAFFVPGERKIALEKVVGFKELSPDEKEMPEPVALSLVEGGPLRTRLARLFLLEAPDARLTVRVNAEAPLFDTQALFNATIDEKWVTLRAILAVHPAEGRVYSVVLNVPASWTLTDLRERVRPGSPLAKGQAPVANPALRGIRAEMRREGDAEVWTIALNDAADALHPLELDAIFKLRDLNWSEDDWQTRALNFMLPSISGARRSKNSLAFVVHPSINIAFGQMPAWRTETSGSFEQLGINEATLRAGFVNEGPAGEIRLDLARKKPRGEYDLVAHVLTFEREYWVRADIRLAVVDRAIDELLVTLPPDAKDPLYVNSLDIKEWLPGNAPGQRRIRFNRQWQGVRMIRIEYRAPLVPDTAMDVPTIRVDGDFDGRRRIVFQSAGAVELIVEAGNSLMPASLEETPDFGLPFRNGRALSAYTQASATATATIPAAFKARVFERVPVLGNVIRELELSATIDASGVSRTHAVFTLQYAREQYMPVKLPSDAKLVALSVDDQEVRPVKAPGTGVVAVPLPPRSSARIELIYERNIGALSGFGEWDESGPDTLSIPVGLTNWKICYPPEFSFALKDGNVAVDVPEQSQFFALSFWGALFNGGPRWTTWEAKRLPNVEQFGVTQSPRAVTGQPIGNVQQLKAEEQRSQTDNQKSRPAGALAIPEGAKLKAGKLGGAPVIGLSYRSNTYSHFAARTVFSLAILIGVWLGRRQTKRALYLYVALGLIFGTVVPPAIDWQSPLLAVPFCEGLSAIAVYILLSMLWRAARQFWSKTEEYPIKASAALILLFLLPCAHNSHAAETDPVLIPYIKEDLLSPDSKPGERKVFVPKSVFRKLMAKVHPEKLLDLVDLPNWDDRKNIAAGIPLTGRTPVFTLTLPKAEKVDFVRFLLPITSEIFTRYKLELSEDGSNYEIVADRTQSQLSGWQREAFAPRLVKSVRISGACSEGNFSVSSAEVFSPPSTVGVAAGNALYEMTVDEKTWQCKGTIDIATFDPKAWATVPLDFGLCEVVSASIDGQPVSVAHELGVPFVQINGSGKHKVEVELRGPLTLTPGRAQLQTRFVSGTATRLAITLPIDVELDTRALPSGASIEKNTDAKTQRCEIDLGGGLSAPRNKCDAMFQSRDVELSWHSADIRGKAATQIAARNYSLLQLGPGGYGVYRVERITSDGGGADQFSYKVIGRWEIASVTATGLSEWSVSGEGEEKRLRLWFQKPVNETLVQVAGWAELHTEKPDAEAQVATLVLEGAVRQEGFIGLQHGDGLRFTPRSLDGLKRASNQELSTMFTLPAESLPDRIYHCHEAPLKFLVSAELEPWQTSIETQIVGVVEPARLTACVRSRYTATGRTAFRHEVELPAGWEVRTVRCNAMRSWEVLADGAKRKLVLYFTSHATTGTEVIWSAERALELPAKGSLTVDLPLLRASGDAKSTETFDWILAADQSLSLSESGTTTLHSLPLERAPAWVRLDGNQEYHFAYRSPKPDGKLVIEVSRRSSVVSATAVSFVRASEDFVQVNARVRFQIEQAGMDHFNLKLPAGAQLVSLAARNLRERTVTERADGSLVSVLLQSPVSGEQILEIALRLPRTAAQDAIVGPISFEGTEIKQVEQFVGIMQADRGQVVVAAKKGLSSTVESESLPFVPEKISSAALAQVFAAEPDWSLTLRQPDVKVEVGQSAEVALAVLKTVIAADGGVRSIASYTIRNRSLQFFAVALPTDATLWGVTVDGQAVTVSNELRPGRKVLLIPIQRMSLTDLPIEVALVYESAHVNLPAAYISVTPLAPEVLDMPVIESYWQLFVPSDYEVTRSGGNLKDVAGSVLIGGKLKSNMNEVERLMKIADHSETTVQKRNALRGVARKQQELSDYSVELDKESQKKLDATETNRISRDELQAQMEGNRVVREQAGNWAQTLQARSKDLEEAVAGGADAEQQQAFLDNYNFLGNGWRGGARYKKPVEAPKPLVGDVSWLLLRNTHLFAGFAKGELLAPPRAPISENAEPLPAGPGLRDDSGGELHLEKNPIALIVPEMGTKLTYSRLEGHPQLTITLRSKTSSWRYASIAGLLIAIAIAAFIYRRRSKTARPV